MSRAIGIVAAQVAPVPYDPWRRSAKFAHEVRVLAAADAVDGPVRVPGAVSPRGRQLGRRLAAAATTSRSPRPSPGR